MEQRNFSSPGSKSSGVGRLNVTPAFVRTILGQREVGTIGSGPEVSSAECGGVRGDHDLNPGFTPPDRLRPAAVLVGLQSTNDGPVIVLTRRAAHLSAHAGQISFPGGRCDVTDCDHVATALRESWEEIGLSPDHVSPLGRLDTYVTRTGFEVVPIVGWIAPAFQPKIASEEVAEIFTVPIDVILRPGNLKRHTRSFQGRDRFFYAFEHAQWYIWGATAGMLVNLRDVLTGSQVNNGPAPSSPPSTDTDTP
jgi:8-oxo-dGTP pyrophosphatase MutT (NUDIX family)